MGKPIKPRKMQIARKVTPPLPGDKTRPMTRAEWLKAQAKKVTNRKVRPS